MFLPVKLDILSDSEVSFKLSANPGKRHLRVDLSVLEVC